MSRCHRVRSCFLSILCGCNLLTGASSLEIGSPEELGEGGSDAATADVVLDGAGDAAQPQECTATPCVVALAAAGRTTCALADDGVVRCWGHNRFGVVGGEAMGDVAVPRVVPFAGPVDEVSLGDWGQKDTTACARLGGLVECWGKDGNERRLGRGGDAAAPEFVPAPAPVVDLDAATGGVGVGSQYVCARLGAGDLGCWGKSYDGKLHTSPVPFPTPKLVKAIVGGRSHHCALLESDEVACAGWALYSKDYWDTGAGPGQSGFAIVPGLTGISQVATMGNFSCALGRSDGKVLCWGRNHRGQLGRGVTSKEALTPEPVVLPGPATFIGVGHEHACAILSDSTVWCWGSNGGGAAYDGGAVQTTRGQVGAAGDGGLDPVAATPRRIDGLPSGAVRAVVGGYEHTCALMASGAVYCWGGNTKGQLGRGSVDPSPHPIPERVLF